MLIASSGYGLIDEAKKLVERGCEDSAISFTTMSGGELADVVCGDWAVATLKDESVDGACGDWASATEAVDGDKLVRAISISAGSGEELENMVDMT